MHASLEQPNEPPGGGEKTRTAAGRVFAMFDAFAHSGGALTLSEISRHANLSLTTTHRLAKEALAWGGLEQDDAGRYRLSRKILDLASTSTRALRLREAALPFLIGLHQETQLTVHLGVRDGREIVYVEALRSHPNYTGENRIGGRLPLHAAAAGIVLLAYGDEDVVDDYVSEPLHRYTEYTPADAKALRDCIERTRSVGAAVVEGFLVRRGAAVAAPVTGVSGRVDAAVGVVYRAGTESTSQLIESVRITASKISEALRPKRQSPHPSSIEYNRGKHGLD